MRTLFVSPRQCWPAISGAKLRDYHFARALGARSELTYVYYADPGSAPLTKQHLPFAKEIIAVPRPRSYSPAKLLQGLLGRFPLSVINYQSAPMNAALERLFRQADFDVVHLDATQLAGFAGLIERFNPRAQVVYDWHNIESELLYRYAESSSSLRRKFYARMTASRMEELETRLLESRAAHLLCSERELARVKARVPLCRASVIENGVDTSRYDPAIPAGSPRSRILFVGLMAYHANADAAIWFARDVWPTIRERLAGFTFTIVGANPGESVLALRSEPAVEVTGTVPDVRPFYEDAFAVVVPLRTGSGTRLKILEAMAAGVPVISTPLGAEGLHVSPGRDLLVANKPEDWHPLLLSLRDQSRWSSIASSARSLVKNCYDWKIIGDHLLNTYADFIGSNPR